MIVNKSSDLAEMLTDQNGIADSERSAVDEQRGARTEALLQLRLDHETVGAAIGIGLKLENFRLNENILKE